MDIRSYKRLINASNEERTKMFSTLAAIKHENKVLNKMKIVNQVRDLKNKRLSKSAISRKIGINTRTISKYLDKNFDPVHASYGIKKGGILSPFYSDINNLLKQGIMSSKIEKIILEKRFKGSSSTIRHYASE